MSTIEANEARDESRRQLTALRAQLAACEGQRAQTAREKGDAEALLIRTGVKWAECQAQRDALAGALRAVMLHPHVTAYLPYDPRDPVFVEAMDALRALKGTG